MKKFNLGDRITFEAIDNFAGTELVLNGTVIGDGKDIRNLQPQEFGEADDCYLVKVDSGRLHVVNIFEILK